MPRAFVIGIAGGSGSGKTTLLERLLGGPFGPSVAVLPHDAYYLDRADMPPAVRDALNFDHPDSLDNALFVRHLEELRAGRAVEQPVYDFRTHARTERTVRVEPRPVLLLDGILLLAVPEVAARLDLRVFVDTPADLRVLRRLARDVSERGRTVEGVTEQYVRTVRPMHERYVEPGRATAHLVIPWESHNGPAVEVLEARIGARVVSAPRG
ncbi:MAG: uridine kinase [Gemmataceae bacterium]